MIEEKEEYWNNNPENGEEFIEDEKNQSFDRIVFKKEENC